MDFIVDPNKLFATIPAHMCSASQSELGDTAGAITWRNCLALADENTLPCIFDYDAARAWFKEYGAWDAEEIDTWTERALRAMVIQEIAADYRAQAERGARQDQVCHNLIDGLMYCYFGV